MPKKKLKWTHLAIEDMNNIKRTISEDNPSAAENMIKTIRNKVERLKDFPTSGRVVPEFRSPALREVIVPPYRVVYRVVSSEIHILRVWHSKQEIK
ncbi:MAG: Toxin RelE2 [Candidatus Methanoperedenaceae archaeon GB50]|nr:Toxin RelE2 [Candidatus Methanoperedenaceae archaeon GB50]CAD7773971.1 MAG: Toxin RelE2 [Candidatus Methanoperedenaceae archaeon GB50]